MFSTMFSRSLAVFSSLGFTSFTSPAQNNRSSSRSRFQSNAADDEDDDDDDCPSKPNCFVLLLLETIIRLTLAVVDLFAHLFLNKVSDCESLYDDDEEAAETTDSQFVYEESLASTPPSPTRSTFSSVSTSSSAFSYETSLSPSFITFASTASAQTNSQYICFPTYVEPAHLAPSLLSLATTTTYTSLTLPTAPIKCVKRARSFVSRLISSSTNAQIALKNSTRPKSRAELEDDIDVEKVYELVRLNEERVIAERKQAALQKKRSERRLAAKLLLEQSRARQSLLKMMKVPVVPREGEAWSY